MRLWTRTTIFTLKIFGKIKFWKNIFRVRIEEEKLGYRGKHLCLKWPITLSDNIFLGDYVYIYEGSRFIIGPGGKFVMKSRSGASQNLTVITGKHGAKVGEWFYDSMITRDKDIETTVTVNEDARLGFGVTLMPGVTIGRGGQIGACSVVTHDIPPYAIAAGVPAKVIKFIFTPEQIIEHEKALYPVEERLLFEDILHIQHASVVKK